MDEDLEFLNGPFPFKSNSPEPQAPPVNQIVGGPSSAKLGEDLDSPLPLPMVDYDHNQYFSNQPQQPQYSQQPQTYPPTHMMGNFIRPPSGPPSGVSMMQSKGKYPAHMSMSCIDIANHLTDCPVCSKLHKSNAPIYMGLIIALIIIIFFLGRKFFD